MKELIIMINYNENKNEYDINRYDISRPRPKQGHEQTKFKVCRYDDLFM